MIERHDVIVVGGGHGGTQAAATLRQLGFAGSVAIIGEEADPPYDRPSLSKDYLAGIKPFERMLARPGAFWSDRRIDLLLGRRVISVDAGRRVVAADDGRVVGYGVLIWAAGGSPRRLTCSGHDLPGVHAIRTRADVDRLRTEIPNARRAVVIGGGYIGLEAAAVLVKAGLEVVLLEALDRVLARVAGEPLSRFYEREHRGRGVDVRLGAKVACLEERSGRAAGVRLADGRLLPADIVIVGVGIEPAVGALLAAGADGGNGVMVDARCRTSLPDVYAIGDCALHHNRYAPAGPIRLESVQNANDMAVIAARDIVGDPVEYDAVPWFWSNQYDLKLQTVGLSAGHDAAVVRGEPSSRSFSIVYQKDGRVIALDCVNSVRDYVQGRALVTSAALADPGRLADATTPLKDLISPS